MHVVGLSGSLRSGSSNARLLRAAAKMAADWARFTFYDRQIGELPHFSPDLDSEGSVAPLAVAELRGLLASADAVLVCCPEYAHGVPGSFKNALDWIVSSGELTDKPVALIMASASGAEQARAALVPTLKVMGANLVFDCSLVLAPKYFAGDGTISDQRTADVVHEALGALTREAAREKFAQPGQRSA
jgi:chromate reductase, NAD(P)H dehydrogenase (quinone)